MVLNILQCVGGFLLQILPCAFFCLYPFYDDLRYPRKKVLSAFIGILAVMTILFTWLYIKLQVPSAEHIDHLPLEIAFLITLVLFFLLYIFCIDAPIVHKVFIFFIVMNYGFLMSEMVSYLIHFFGGSYEDYLYSPRTFIFQLVLNGILFYPMLDLMRYMQKAVKSDIPDKKWWNLITCPAVFILTLFIFYKLLSSTTVSASFIPGLFSKAMGLLMFLFYYWTFRIIEQERLLAEEQAHLLALVDHYASMADSTEKVREARHEIMHHVTALSMLIKSKDYAGAENYLDKISKTTDAIPAPPHTPHPFLNSILTEYKKRAEADHIQVTYQIFVPASLSIDNSDLCQLISNLLDNSLEGCAYVDPQKRSLHLTIRQKGNFLFFSCENSCNPSQIKYMNGKPLSTKLSSDNKAHGFGIPIMERIAEKYNGMLRTSIKGNYFTVDINMCLT